MADFGIGLSGLDAAQKALSVIGNNIANSATDGYHRQIVDLSPAFATQNGGTLLGGGVDVKDVRRVIDNLLEQEIFQQQSASGQVSQESSTLSTIESAFGELSSQDSGLNAAIDKLFTSLQDLSANPADIINQTQVVSDADAMAGQFRTLGELLTTTETQIKSEAGSTVDSINTLTSQIAELNQKIEGVEIVNGNANTMCDQRDKCISDLSKLIGIQTVNRNNGVVDVALGGIPLVIGASSTKLEVGVDENANLGISIAGASNYITDVQGGKLGGLLSLKNDIVSNIHDNLNSLAATIIQQINQCHVQGVGSEGSFTKLTGCTNTSENLADFSNVTAGYTYIRVTKISDGSVVRTAIPVLQNSSSDSLTDIAGFINTNVANTSAYVNSSNQLSISAANGYKFDFLPAALPEPKTADIHFHGTSNPDVSVSGIYTGTSNDTLTFTVSRTAVTGTGDIGVDDQPLTLTVKDSESHIIDTFNIGSGYAAGDKIDIGNTGIKVALGTGNLVNGDSFSIDVFGNTDTSGLLSAVGLNTFFSGSSALDMAVCSDITDNPRQVATSLGAEMTDNTNAVRMTNIKDKVISGLDNLTCGDFYRKLVTDVGQQVSDNKTRQDNIDAIVQNLTNQQNETSGVDINDEAAKLLVFQQMFQAMAKYMTTVNATMTDLMNIIATVTT